MTDSNSQELDPNCGCAPGECCPPPGGAQGGGSGKKIFLFTFVMIIALGLAGYSFSKKFGDDAAIDVTCGTALASVTVADEVIKDKKVAFVFLAGDNPGPAQEISALVEGVVGKLDKQGKQAVAITLGVEAEGYDGLLEGFEIKSFPAVIVAGYGCQITTLTDDISEEKLLRAYVLATTPKSECGPGGSADCCPK